MELCLGGVSVVRKEEKAGSIRPDSTNPCYLALALVHKLVHKENKMGLVLLQLGVQLPPTRPKPQPSRVRAKSRRGCTYKLAPAASPKPPEHLCNGSVRPGKKTLQPDNTPGDRSLVTSAPPSGLASDAFLPGETCQQRRLPLAELSRRPIRDRFTRLSLCLATRGIAFKFRKCDSFPVSDWSAWASIIDPLAYPEP